MEKFLRKKVMNKDFTLQKPLDWWTFQLSTQKWSFYYSRERDCVYRCYCAKWNNHSSYIFDSHPRTPQEVVETTDDKLSDIDDDTILYDIPLDCESQENHFPFDGEKQKDHFASIFPAKQLYQFSREEHDVELSIDAVPADPI